MPENYFSVAKNTSNLKAINCHQLFSQLLMRVHLYEINQLDLCYVYRIYVLLFTHVYSYNSAIHIYERNILRQCVSLLARLKDRRNYCMLPVVSMYITARAGAQSKVNGAYRCWHYRHQEIKSTNAQLGNILVSVPSDFCRM